jgi:hypothetical protein
VGKWIKMYGSCWGLWPLCVFGCISAVIVKSVCVRDCRELGLYIVGTVGYSVGECVQGRGIV